LTHSRKESKLNVLEVSKLSLKECRLRAGLSTYDVARALHYKAASAITMWETGLRHVPSKRLLELASLYDCNVEELLKGGERRAARNVHDTREGKSASSRRA
jgi:transcriptional regulator with XRE-family HTH domain